MNDLLHHPTRAFARAQFPFLAAASPTGAHNAYPVPARSFLGDDVTVEEARGKGHMHVSDFVAHAHRFQVRAQGGSDGAVLRPVRSVPQNFTWHVSSR